ncbi:MAG: AtpZ/AtpI family protein [Phycisphaerales bacterium]|nr:AtpZ/AtpI family protein [Phycisphaerales bacterium]
MAHPADDPDRRPPPPPGEDPRLAIPEVLRQRPEDRAPDAPPPQRESFGDTAKAWGMALDLVFTTIGGLALGWGFDWWRGTAPWGAIIGLGVGFLTAAARLIRYSLKAEAKEREARDRAKQGRG